MFSFPIKRLFLYLEHFIKAKSDLYLHSPFVYDFYNQVIKGEIKPSYQKINELKNKLSTIKDSILVNDLGAGSHKMQNNKRSISEIAKYNGTPYKQGCFLARLTAFTKPKTILEYGTSLGISSIYIASEISSDALLYSMEGDAELSSIAKNNIASFGINNIALNIGEFNECFETISNKIEKLDMVYFDGNHQKEPTIKYFHDCLKYAHEDTIFIFDDIRWTKGMNDAWDTIKAHPRVSLTIDLFSFGLVFFRHQAKENFHFIL